MPLHRVKSIFILSIKSRAYTEATLNCFRNSPDLMGTSHQNHWI